MALSGRYLVHPYARSGLVCGGSTLSRRGRPHQSQDQGKDFKYWSRVGGKAYCFADKIGEEAFRGLLRDAFRLGLEEPGFDSLWRPGTIVKMDGTEADGTSYLGGLLVRKRLAGKQPAVGRARAPDVSDGGDHSHRHSWRVADPRAGFPLGTLIRDLAPDDLKLSETEGRDQEDRRLA